jgi:hypothetical protein
LRDGKLDHVDRRSDQSRKVVAAAIVLQCQECASSREGVLRDDEV